MKSIGISIKEKTDDKATHKSDNKIESDNKIQLHLNLWRSPAGRHQSKLPFNLDIGVMAKFTTAEIQIYLPFTLRKVNRWQDLGHIMIENRQILCSLFNEDYNIAQLGNSCYHKVSPAGSDSHPENSSNDSFYICTLREADIKFIDFEDIDTPGVIIHITVPSHKDIKPSDEFKFYIRFRVPIIGYEELTLQCNLSNNPIQAAFTKLDLYNFQINEQRDIPYNAMGYLKVKNFRFPQFSKIHLLYIVDPRINVENGSLTKCDSRIVDPTKWMAYIPDKRKSDAYLAYHWRIEPKIRLQSQNIKPESTQCRLSLKKYDLWKANLFFSAKYPDKNWLTIAAYCSVAIILGCIGSIVASYICGSVSLSFKNVGGFIFFSLIVYFIVWYLSTHWNQLMNYFPN